MTNPTPRRRLVAGLALVAALVVPTAVDTAPVAARAAAPAGAEAMSSDQVTVFNQVNASRRSQGRRLLRTNGMMNQRAMNWARHLMSIQDCEDQPCLVHRNLRTIALSGWYAVGENIGRSGNYNTLAVLHQAFMNSTGHRHNILNRRWTDIGVGVVQDAQGEYFVVHAFADYSR